MGDHIQRGVGMRYLTITLALVTGAASAASIVHTISAPDDEIIGMAWQDNGSLWAVDNASGWIYELDPDAGTVLSSFYPDLASSYIIFGVAVTNDTLIINYGKGTTGGGQYSMYDCGTGNYIDDLDVC
jgi:hypothetical protein